MSLRNWSKDSKPIAATGVLAIGLVGLGVFSFRKIWPNQNTGWIIWLGLAAGGLGGVLHEFAQGGGKLLLTKREPDGISIEIHNLLDRWRGSWIFEKD